MYKASILYRKISQRDRKSLGTEDEGPFEMRLLHFRRTFVEKLFAIHSKVEKFKQTGIGIDGGGWTGSELLTGEKSKII